MLLMKYLATNLVASNLKFIRHSQIIS